MHNGFLHKFIFWMWILLVLYVYLIWKHIIYIYETVYRCLHLPVDIYLFIFVLFYRKFDFKKCISAKQPSLLGESGMLTVGKDPAVTTVCTICNGLKYTVMLLNLLLCKFYRNFWVDLKKAVNFRHVVIRNSFNRDFTILKILVVIYKKQPILSRDLGKLQNYL